MLQKQKQAASALRQKNPQKRLVPVNEKGF